MLKTVLLFKFISSGMLIGLVAVCTGLGVARLGVTMYAELSNGLGMDVINVIEELGRKGCELRLFLLF